ncbi:spore germination protein, partial [Paenibacillus alkaliterrae]
MKEKLYPFHVAVLTYMNQTGVIIMSLPRLLAENFGYNGWVALIGLSLIATLNIWIISLVHRLGKGKSIFEIFERSLPKVLLYPLYTFLAVVWSILGCMVAKNYVNIFQIISYNTTHAMILKLLVDILVYLLVIKGIYNISKATTSFFWIVNWMVFLLLFFVRDFEWARLTPFLFSGETNVFQGGLSVFTAFLGYEVCILLFPYAENNKKFMRAVMVSSATLIVGEFGTANDGGFFHSPPTSIWRLDL